MSIAIWFWIIFILALIFLGYGVYQNRSTWPNIVIWVLLFLLGLAAFGSPVKGAEPTPHVNPSASPSPDTVLASTPGFFMSPWFYIPALLVTTGLIFFAVKKLRKQTKTPTDGVYRG
jgi:hypothetical protein